MFWCCCKRGRPKEDKAQSRISFDDLVELKTKNEKLKKENQDLKEEIEKQAAEIEKLEEECEKQRGAINQIPHNVQQDAESNTTTDRSRGRRMPVLGEQIHEINVEPTNKTADERVFLEKAIQKNDLLCRYDIAQISKMIDYMTPADFSENDIPIIEGTHGDRFYVLENGNCEVFQGNQSLNVVLGPGDSFGEMAILYDCKRTATVKANTSIKVWYLERNVFLYVVSSASRQQRAARVEVLSKVPFLSTLKKRKIIKIADTLAEEEYKKKAYLTREGAYGDTFFIIKKGIVSVSKKQNGKDVEIRQMHETDCFGEKALKSDDDIRTASVVAVSDVVQVYTLGKKAFCKLIGDLADIDWDSKDRKTSEESDVSTEGDFACEYSKLSGPFENMTLERDFQFVELLGAGGFGRVELIQSRRNKEQTFALKCMKRIHIVETRQEQHIIAERSIMLNCDSQFIVKLHRTYKNSRYVYMLLEPCLGGELWTQLRSACQFDESRARFYSACVIEALSYLHTKGVVYRDLKPENLLLDKRGYVKLCDFGFAKRLKPGERTWTFCGTPEYVAPEIILNHGHDIAVDYWALGILIYELLTGNPPFNSADAMRTYRMILKGIDAVDMPLRIKRVAQNLIKRLCRENPSERLGNLAHGIDDIRRHRWFSGFDWEGLRQGSTVPEFIPIVENPTDVRNFDQFERDEEESFKVPEDNSSWAKNF